MKEFSNITFEATPKTPQIDLNQFTGELIISGKSIPENAVKIYEPVINWLSEYILKPRPTTNLRLNLEYFNTASSIWLAKVLKTLVKIDNPDFVLIIHLYFPLEDFDELKEVDDIKEAFAPITDIFIGATPSVGLRIYGTDEAGKIIKDSLIFI